ncbi:alpha/beta fold hydrolase [Georgenia yuyongxinii]|uniref:Alpha/beta fold hydrolase n=1 Tax=Georgenia yuyongxinii TaxID=2589797 RepID=A0A5B8BZJ8_9MICO|nr:alpha/beta fold hydrolase [Georgenia yuyongxinii]QDC23744.1 alpha/beta fold hydrolase [Georgenia yuyongxinii]
MDRLTTLRRGRLVFDVRDDGPDDGEPVVLLHGFPQDSSCWGKVAPLLHQVGLRTLALDQRGYSPGARPPGRGAYRLSWVAADVVALLDAAGLARAHLVGHDWGGAVTWAVAADAPERVASATVLSTPHPRAFARALPRSDQPLRSWYILFEQLPALPELLLRAGLQRGLRDRGLPAADAARYARRMREPGALTGALNWYRAIPFYATALPGRVRVPVTYVFGEHDFALSRSAAEGSAALVDGDYRFVALDAGHWLPETRPDEVARAVVDRVRSARGDLHHGHPDGLWDN